MLSFIKDKELKIMKENKNEKSEGKKKGQPENIEETFPHCTTAPSAEHARAYDDDEPCDDSRTG